MAETFICSVCHTEHPIEDLTTFGGRAFCPECLQAETCVCDRCGERIWLLDAYCDGTHTLCGTCEENYYTHCADCGRLVEYSQLRYLGDDDDDDDDGYCESCYNRHIQASGVQGYCYKPKPIFYGNGTRYLGVELEIDGAGESDCNANILRDIGNREHNHIYIKHDGSLDSGLEIVTHPMTLAYHMTEMPWRDLMKKAISMDYLSHQTGTCGLHIHVNRDSLGITNQQQENTIARILFLVETFWHELLRFSRRTQGQMDHWAARYGRKDDPKDVLYTAKHKGDRYTCVNLTPSQTIEFRMFRGTLKYNTLIATLQMVEIICDVASALSDDEIKKLTWTEFVSNLYEDTTPELIQYLKERRLYVNEPVYSTEEEM